MTSDFSKKNLDFNKSPPYPPLTQIQLYVFNTNEIDSNVNFYGTLNQAKAAPIGKLVIITTFPNSSLNKDLKEKKTMDNELMYTPLL